MMGQAARAANDSARNVRHFMIRSQRQPPQSLDSKPRPQPSHVASVSLVVSPEPAPVILSSEPLSPELLPVLARNQSSPLEPVRKSISSALPSSKTLWPVAKLPSVFRK